MILKARTTDAGHVSFLVKRSDGGEAELVAAMIPPSEVQRSTGTFRNPDLLVHLPPKLVSALLGASEPEGDGMVIALIVNTASRRGAAVGAFADTAVAKAWWQQPYNRLARDPDVLFLTVPVEADV
ncbi:hypothetical protein [Micromonospora sp. NPDC005313]|uniref:hypothetical protein n=1 Tax=Micromonospora sp. NPDC005313 TaxID=3154296 RepID=UPI0033A80DC2